MAKISKISGFPEWLPGQKLVEQRLVEKLRAIYEGYGFTPIETPAVELLTTLGSKGVIDKEIFAVKRLKAEEGDEAELGLHFDLTVPFARYVAQHANDLVFPFKRYQLQKVWRGDRPQKGRFREFYQFDIDVIARETLPLSCDAEVLSAACEALSALELGPFRVRVNNRKVLTGVFRAVGFGPDSIKSAITAVDKLNKIGASGVSKELLAISGVTQNQVDLILKSTDIRAPLSDFADKLAALNLDDEGIREGTRELQEIAALLSPHALKHAEFDGSLARGLDYYSGAIFEAEMINNPEFGTVTSGGRYDNLASDFTDQKLPGVGVSIGLTRLLDLAFSNNLLNSERQSPSQVLVTVFNEEQRVLCNSVAQELRGSGIPTEVFYKSPKLGKQIEYAEAKGMRYVFFVDSEGSAISGMRVKDLQSKEQIDIASTTEWLKRRF